ncbi:MAG: hypothetical protein MJ197_03550 [Bacteroidales bacterium]|nr:hypothetical protein [Bacteroidales bacterium]
MSSISDFIKTKLKFNPFTGKMDMVGSNADAGYVTKDELALAVEPFKAQTNNNFQDISRTLRYMQESYNSANALATEAKELAEACSTNINHHWETFPVLASETGDEFSQLASGIQDNQGVIFWMSIPTPIKFSECIIYASSFPKEYKLQIGIYDENDIMLYNTDKYTVTKYGTIRFSFIDKEGNTTTCTLSNDKLYQIAIWSSANNFRLLAGQDCSAEFQTIRQLMSSKLYYNPGGLTTIANKQSGTFVNRFPYIKLVG